MKKRLLAAVISMAMVVGLVTACSTPSTGGNGGGASESESEGEGEASGEKVFRYATNTEPTSLDPNMGNSIGDNEIQHAITEGLTRNTGGDTQPGMAESWDISEDGTVYTFHLRESKWSDGEPVKAGDYEYSWKRLADPATGSAYQFIVGIIKNGNAVIAGEKPVDELGVKAIDDSTLEVTLENPTSYFLSMLGAQSNFAPLRQDVVEEYGSDFAATADKNVYSGPFKLVSSENNEYVFEKNENFWDTDSIKLDRCELSYIENTQTQVALYEEGDLDFVKVPTESVEAYKDKAEHFTNGNVDYCYINTESENKVFGNKNFRLALNYGLNRVEYNELANAGVYTPYNALVFPNLQAKGTTYGEAYDVNSYAYPIEGDIDAAKDYLKKAMDELGIADPGDIEIEFVTTDAESNKKIAEVLQEQWQKNLGIKVNIRQVTYSDIYGEVYPKMDYEIGYAGWGPDYDDPYTYLELFRSDVNWYTPYGNEEVDALLDASKTETDLDKRMDMLNEAEQILIADGAWVPLQARDQWYLLDEDVTGVEFYYCSINIDWVYADIAE